MTVAAGYAPTVVQLTQTNLGPFSTVWPYDLPSDVQAWLSPASGVAFAQLSSAVDYSQAATAPLTNGGTITLASDLMPSNGWAAGAQLVLTRATALNQPSAFGEVQGFSPQTSEQALDHSVRQIQETAAQASRAVCAPLGEPGQMLPPMAERAGRIASWDAVSGVFVPQSGVTNYTGTGLDFAYGPAQGGETTFTLPFQPAQAWTLRLQRNGVVQSTRQYGVNATTLTLTTPLTAGETLYALDEGGKSAVPVSASAGFETVLVASGVDCTAAVNAALATGQHVFIPPPALGMPSLTDKLTFTAPGQKLFSVSRGGTTLLIPRTANMNATSFLQLQADCEVENIGFMQDQSQATARASLIAYPYLIDISNATRPRLRSLRFSTCYRGINAKGSCGGAFLEDIEAGCFLSSLDLDGALDDVRIDNWHNWPFGGSTGATPASALLFSIFCDGQTQSWNMGRADSFHAKDCEFFMGHLSFFNSVTTTGLCSGWMRGIALDEYAHINMGGQELHIDGLTKGIANENDYALYVQGGRVEVDHMEFSGSQPSIYPVVRAENNGTRVIINSGYVGQLDPTTIDYQVSLAAWMTVNDVLFDEGTNQTRTAPLVNQLSGGRLTMTGCRGDDKGTGAATCVSLADDSFHVVTNNMFPGWTYNTSAAPTNSIIGPNK